MEKGVNSATRIILRIMFTGYLTNFYILCHATSYHLSDYHQTADCDNDPMYYYMYSG